MGEKSQIILDYPLKPEVPANMLFLYKSDVIENELDNKIISSKKLFKYEETEKPTEYERLIKKFGMLAIEQDKKFSKLVDLPDPKDSDFNFLKVQKLSHEQFYDIIDENILKFQNTEKILKVFVKPNVNVNYFLSDFSGIPFIKDNDFKDGSINVSNNLLPADKTVAYKAIPVTNTYSQGKAFFFISTLDPPYEVVKEYEDGIYIEVKNNEFPDQIGIFKKADFQQIMLSNDQKQNLPSLEDGGKSTTSQQNLQESSKGEEDQIEISNKSTKLQVNTNSRLRSPSKKSNQSPSKINRRVGATKK